MTENAPPPVIDSARVIAYAFVDDIPYQRCGSLYSGDRLIEHVPRLVICLNLGADIGPLLFHCDEQWNVLGTSGASTIEETKLSAEKNYPGVTARWIDVNTSVTEALDYYDQATNGAKCSFCGKRPFEMDGGWVEGNNGALICRECVENLYRGFQKDSTGDSRD